MSACDFSVSQRHLNRPQAAREGIGGMMAAAEPGSPGLVQRSSTGRGSRSRMLFVISERRHRHRRPIRSRLLLTLTVLSCLVLCTRADHIRTSPAFFVAIRARERAVFPQWGAIRAAGRSNLFLLSLAAVVSFFLSPAFDRLFPVLRAPRYALFTRAILKNGSRRRNQAMA